MIDNKKIEKAAKHYAEENSMSIEDQMGDTYNGIEELSDAYKAGAKWAINEFLKDLWHPASEKPQLRNGKCLVVYNCGKIDIFKISFVYEMLSNYGKDGMSWEYWCYISDLFPKKGGEQ